MGRKPGKKGAEHTAPKQTLEGLTDDQHYSLIEQHRKKYESLLATKKKSAADLTNYCKIIKADLGAHGLDQIKSVMEGASPEGEAAIKARIARDMNALRWLGVPIGTQSDLFPTDDRTPIGERAFNEGKRQGLAGETNSNPHHQTTEAYRKHDEGYRVGQETLAKGFKPLADAPKGSSPKEDDPNKEWRDNLAKQNDEVERQIKESSKLGSSRATYEMQH